MKSNEAHIFTRHSRKLFSDQTRNCLHAARSDNQCLMIIHIVDTNVMLAVPFKNKTIQQLTETCIKLKK